MLYRVGCLKPVWNILSAMKICLSYSYTSKIMNKLDSVSECLKSKKSALDGAILVADNIQFSQTVGDSGFRFGSQTEYLHCVNILELFPEQFAGKNILEDSENVDGFETSFCLNGSQEIDDETFLESSESISKIQQNLQDLLQQVENFQIEVNSGTWVSEKLSDALKHVFPLNLESSSLLHYPTFQKSIEPSKFHVFAPLTNVNSSSLKDMQKFLDFLEEKFRISGNKRFVFLFGDESFLKVLTSLKKTSEGKYSWLYLFPGEFHF